MFTPWKGRVGWESKVRLKVLYQLGKSRDSLNAFQSRKTLPVRSLSHLREVFGTG